MLAPPFPAVLVANGWRGLPLSRAWPSLAHGTRSALPLRRPAGGDGDISRRQRATTASLCTCHADGARAHTCVVQPRPGRARRSKSRQDLRPAVDSPGSGTRKKVRNPLLGGVCLLTIRVLILVRCFPILYHYLYMCNLRDTNGRHYLYARPKPSRGNHGEGL